MAANFMETGRGGVGRDEMVGGGGGGGRVDGRDGGDGRLVGGIVGADGGRGSFDDATTVGGGSDGGVGFRGSGGSVRGVHGTSGSGFVRSRGITDFRRFTPEARRKYLNSVLARGGYPKDMVDAYEAAIVKEINSPLHVAVANEVIENAELVTSVMGKRPVVRLTVGLTQVEKDALEVAFNEVSFQYVPQGARGGHALANAVRQTERFLMLRRLEGHNKILDIGGDHFLNIKQDRGKMHSCEPVADRMDGVDGLRDRARHAKRKQQLADFVRNAYAKPHVNRTRAENRAIAFSTDDRVAASMLCNNKVQDCTHQATGAMALHSAYDIPMEDWPSIMSVHGLEVVYGSLILPPTFDADSEVKMLGVRCKIRGDVITYEFENDQTLAYRHSLKNLRRYATINTFVNGGETVVYRPIIRRECGVVFEIRRYPYAVSLESVPRAVATGSTGQFYKLRSFSPDDHDYSGGKKVDRTYVEVPKEKFEAVWRRALGEDKLTIRTVISWIIAYDAGFSVNSVRIYGTERVWYSHVVTFAITVYLMAKRGMNESKALLGHFVEQANRDRVFDYDLTSLGSLTVAMKEYYLAFPWLSIVRNIDNLLRPLSEYLILAVEALIDMKQIEAVVTDFLVEVPTVVDVSLGRGLIPESPSVYAARLLQNVDIGQLFEDDDSEPGVDGADDNSSASASNDKMSDGTEGVCGLKSTAVESLGSLADEVLDGIVNDRFFEPEMSWADEVEQELERDGSVNRKNTEVDDKKKISKSLLEYRDYSSATETAVISAMREIAGSLSRLAPSQHIPEEPFNQFDSDAVLLRSKVFVHKDGRRETIVQPEKFIHSPGLYSVDYSVCMSFAGEILPIQRDVYMRDTPDEYEVYRWPPNHKYVLICREFKVWNYASISGALHSAARGLVDSSLPVFELIQGVPGAGKTYQILSTLTSKDVVVCNTKATAGEILDAVVKKNCFGSFKVARKRTRTIDSAAINDVPEAEVLHVDEGLMVHSAMVYLLALRTKAKRVVVYGDYQQVGFIQFFKTFSLKNIRVQVFARVTTHALSRRCPAAAVAAVAGIYLCADIVVRIVTMNTAPEKNVIEHITSIKDVPYRFDTTYIAMYNDERNEIAKAFRPLASAQWIEKNVLTAHRVQGKTVQNVILVRNNYADKELYKLCGHVVVALTRHTCRLSYYTLMDRDAIATALRRGNENAHRYLVTSGYEDHVTTVNLR